MNPTYKVNDKILTSEGYIITITKYINNKTIHVIFDDGYSLIVGFSALKSGQIKNKNHKTVFGIGYFGYGDFDSTTNRKIYQAWKDMFTRCYSKEYHKKQPTYIGCSVHSEWHNYQIFAKWYVENYVDGCQIDKDLKLKNNKIYSHKNCIFLPKELNNALQTIQTKNSILPVGVRLETKTGKFVSQCNIGNKIRISKTFSILEDAVSFYNFNKEKCIKDLAKKYENIIPLETYKLLMQWKVES